jgi:nucleoside-diphosphate-sugar epimerase
LYSNSDLPTDRPYEHREDDPLPRRFINAYAATKAEAEKCLLYSQIPHVIFRPRAIVGSGDPSIMPRLIRLAQRGFLPRFSKADPRTDLTHVTDVARVLVDAAMSRALARQRIYNVSSGEPVRLYAFLKEFFQGVGLPIRFVWLPQAWVRQGVRVLEGPWSRWLPKVEMPMTEMAIDLFTRDQWLNIDALCRDFSYVPRYSGSSLFDQLLTDYQEVVASVQRRF